MTGFAVAVIAGLSVGNPATLVLGHAIAAMVVCYVVGLTIATVERKASVARMERLEAAQAAHAAKSPGESGKVSEVKRGAPGAATDGVRQAA